jgi:hypothetical protein
MISITLKDSTNNQTSSHFIDLNRRLKLTDEESSLLEVILDLADGVFTSVELLSKC